MYRETFIHPNQADHYEDRRQVPGPVPGDLIVVEHSGWYALADGELLRVCECDGWATPGRDIYVPPHHQVRTFWGPDFGPPDGIQPLTMSTSGGPFKTITLLLVEPLLGRRSPAAHSDFPRLAPQSRFNLHQKKRVRRHPI